MKRTIAFLLLFAMLFSLCACGGQNGNSGNGETELTTIRILTKNDYDDTTKIEDWEKYDVSKVFKYKLEELGIQLELECIDNAAFANVVRTRMAAGVDLPDIVAVSFDGLGTHEIIQWGQNGLIAPASDLMAQYDTDGSIAAYWDEKCPGTRAANTASDGKLYWFSYLYRPTEYSRETGEELSPYTFRGLSIRQDWVEKVGETVKTVYTPDELFDLLKKFQDQDVNGSGAKDECVDVAIDRFNEGGIADGFGLSTNLLAYIDQNDKVQSNFYNPNLAEYLKFMKRLYDNGLYDTASFSTTSLYSELVAQNKAAVIYNYSHIWNYENQTGDSNAQYTPFILEMDGDLSNGWKSHGDIAGTTFNQYFVTSACKNQEAVMKLFDYIYTDEYAFLDYAGVEGVNYDLDENGIVVPRDLGDIPTDPDEKEEYYKKYQVLAFTGVGLFSLPAMNVVPTYKYEVDPAEPEYMQIKWRAIAEFQKNADTCWFEGATILAQATKDELTKSNQIGATLSAYASEMLTDMILGRKDIGELQNCVAEMELLGLKDFMAIMQAQRDRIINAK